MDSTPTVSDPSVRTPAANPALALSAPAKVAENPPSTHPLIVAAALVWLSVDLIGDGLLALRSLLASLTRERTATPS
jgi:hypothetical protein